MRRVLRRWLGGAADLKACECWQRLPRGAIAGVIREHRLPGRDLHACRDAEAAVVCKDLPAAADRATRSVTRGEPVHARRSEPLPQASWGRGLSPDMSAAVTVCHRV